MIYTDYALLYFFVGAITATMCIWFKPTKDAIKREPKFNSGDWVIMSFMLWPLLLIIVLIGLGIEIFQKFKQWIS